MPSFVKSLERYSGADHNPVLGQNIQLKRKKKEKENMDLKKKTEGYSYTSLRQINQDLKISGDLDLSYEILELLETTSLYIKKRIEETK